MTTKTQAKTLRPRVIRLSRSRGGDAAVVILLLIMAGFMALPLIYTILSAFKPYEELFVFPPRFFVRRPVTDNFLDLFVASANGWVPFTRYVFNSVFISVVGTGGTVVISSMAGYVLSKHEFPGRRALFALVVTSLLFSGKVTYVPQYLMLSSLNLINTYAALILPALGATFGVFLMRQFMEQVPMSVIEAARIDGAGEMRTFFHVVMPMVKPAWLTLIIFTFQSLWNTQTGTIIYSENLKTLPTAFRQIASSGMARYGAGMAASVLLLLPPVAAFIVAQSNIMQTMAHAGIKE